MLASTSGPPKAVDQTTTKDASPLIQRVLWIDGLRALAIGFVVFNHILEMLLLPISSMTDRILVGALQFIFVLSAFCLFLPLIGDPTCVVRVLNLKRFARRRIERIYPPYLAGLALMIMVSYLQYCRHVDCGGLFPWTSQSWLDLGAHVLLIHQLFPHFGWSINPSLWAIALEWQLYILFPIIMWLTRRLPLKTALLVPVAVALLFRTSVRLFGPMQTVGSPLDTCAISQWSCYSAGMIAAAIVSRKVAFGWIGLPTAQTENFWSAVFLSFACVFLSWLGKPWVIIPAVWTAAGGLWLVYLHSYEGRLKRFLNVISPVGRVSYSWYIVHWPVLALVGLLADRCAPTAKAFIMFGVGSVLTLAVGYLFFFLF